MSGLAIFVSVLVLVVVCYIVWLSRQNDGFDDNCEDFYLPAKTSSVPEKPLQSLNAVGSTTVKVPVKSVTAKKVVKKVVKKTK